MADSIATLMFYVFFYKYGKYFFFSHDKIEKIDKFFSSHGEISTFSGRLLPGVRHFIAFPAGLGHMDLKKFCIYTTVGSAIWMAALTTLGYLIGDNEEMVHKYVPYISGILLLAVVILVGLYIHRHKKKVSGNKAGTDSNESK